MEQKHIIPQKALKDTFALLIVLLALPQPIASVVLTLFILTSSSRKFASRLFTKLFGSSHHYSISIPSSGPQSKEQLDSHYFTPLVLIGSVDLVLCLIVRLALPKFTRYVFILADAIIAATLCGNNLWNSWLTTCFIILLEYSIKIILELVRVNFNQDVRTPELFPYLPRITTPLSHVVQSAVSFLSSKGSFPIRSNAYYAHLDQSRLLDYSGWILDHLNLALSIHIVLLVFAATSRKNFISRNINQLTSVDQDVYYSPFSTFLLNKEKEERNIKLSEIELPEEISTSVLKLDHANNIKDSDQAPASYPSHSKSTDDLVSTSSIVQENFEVFCRSSFTKPRNSVKAIQPLWSLVATTKAMSSRKDVYSGSTQVSDSDNNALVLSDSISKFGKYNVDELQNYQDGYRREKILIFIDYIGETLIGFQLQNFDHHEDVIFIRVNGLIWYQVLAGDYNGEQYFVVGGLTPLSQYDIQFLTEEVDENGNKKIVLIDDLIVSTVNSKGDDISTNSNIANSGKHLSPLVTLRESLVTTNENLNKERTKLKKTKKEISKKLATYKQDIEQLKSKISNSDKNDEKNWKKVLSLRNSVKQAEEDVSKVGAELTKVEAEENEIIEVYSVEKRKFDLALRNYQSFKNNFNGKLSVKRELLKELNYEIETSQSKKEKLSNKHEKLKMEAEKIETEIDDLQKHDISIRGAQRIRRSEKRKAMLNEFKNEIEKQEADVLKLQTENEKLKSGLQ